MYYYGIDYDESSLTHYGVKGMKWGVRKSKTSSRTKKKSSRKENRLNKIISKAEKRQNKSENSKSLRKQAIKVNNKADKTLDKIIKQLGIDTSRMVSDNNLDDMYRRQQQQVENQLFQMRMVGML